MASTSFITTTLTIALLSFLILVCRGQTRNRKLVSGPANMTAIAGQNLSIRCIFAEPIDDNNNILWKRSSVDIGRCQNMHPCHLFNSNTKITLNQSNRQSFELSIANAIESDSGSYECGLEYRINRSLSYSRLQSGTVSVISSAEIKSPTCHTLMPKLTQETTLVKRGNLLQLQCSWPRIYTNATGTIITDLPNGTNLNLMMHTNLTTNARNISLSDVVDNTDVESRCVLEMPGLRPGEKSCSFPLQLPPPASKREGENYRLNFSCSALSPMDVVSWFVITNENVFYDQDFPRWIHAEGDNIILNNVTTENNGLVVICTSRGDNEQLFVKGIGQVAVSDQPEPITSFPKFRGDPTELSETITITKKERLGISGNKPTEGTKYVDRPISKASYSDTENVAGTKRENTSESNNSLLHSQGTPQYVFERGELSFYSLPLWMQCLVYFFVISSSLAILHIVIVTVLFCRKHLCRKSGKQQEDQEQPPQVAKVEAIPSHSAADYATIDSSNLKAKSGTMKGDADNREHKTSFRYVPSTAVPLEWSIYPTPADIALYNVSAAPSISKPRTVSKYLPAQGDDSTNVTTSSRRQLLRNFSLQQTKSHDLIQEFNGVDNRGETDEESTLNSRLSCRTMTDKTNNDNNGDAFYFSLDKDSDEEMDNENDYVKTMKTSASDETTLGRNEHAYFTLEQTSKLQGETSTVKRNPDNNCSSPIKNINKNKIKSSCKDVHDSGYDNFRPHRIPYCRNECEKENDYEKLTHTSKG